MSRMSAPVPLVVRYDGPASAAGADTAATPGALIGQGRRWLLARIDPDSRLADDLFGLISGTRRTGPEILEELTMKLREIDSWVWLDLSGANAASTARGTARYDVHDGTHRLTLEERTGIAQASPARRLIAGVVATARAELRASRTERPGAAPAPEASAASAASAPSSPGIIDGIPEAILHGGAPTPNAEPAATTSEPPRPAASARTPETSHTVRRGQPAEEHSHTVYRGGAGLDARLGGGSDGSVPREQTAARADVDHLRQNAHETVSAVRCPAGHFTPALTANCRVCGEPVPQQTPFQMPRPNLGRLRLPDGTVIPLDRGVVFGRQPTAPPGVGEWPRLVRMPPENTYVSRNHLRVQLDGWLVIVTDLGSRAGTTLRSPNRRPQRIRAGEPYIWEPGQVLDLADAYEVLYEVTP